MRRGLIAGLVVALAAVVVPLAARAAASPQITLLSPSADGIVVGETAISWAYQGFSPSAWVDVEAARAGGPFARIARVRIDDGTPGYTGSTTWATGPDDDGADWALRLVVPSNKWVRSAAVPVVVDNTAPEATEVSRTPANAAGWNNDDVTVRWACTDAASGPVEPEVTATVGGEGTGLTASATCTDRAGHATTATATGIDIDRTAPGATIGTTSAVEADAPVLLLGDVSGTASDSLSGVASVAVRYVDETGAETRRPASCTNCGTSEAAWQASTVGLAPGAYDIQAEATDLAGNVGPSDLVTVVVVAAPEPPPVTPPPVTAPEVTPPPVTAPEVTPPPVTAPEVAASEGAPPAVAVDVTVRVGLAA